MRKFDQEQIEKILRRRFFIAPSAQIYGGVSGLYDLGPPAVSVKTNMLALWRRYFVQEENMLEVETTAILPHDVLKASGHVEKFCDILVFDEVTRECYRADHLVGDVLGAMEQTEEVAAVLRNVDCMPCEEIDAVVLKYGIKSVLGNALSKAQQFNLMFGMQIGYRGSQEVFLRPETAQGQFLNFKKLYEYNNEKLPFASASIGRVYRNEISPRAGLLRVREFEQAEIEHFVFADEKDHPKFASVESLVLTLAFDNRTTEMSLRDAVGQHIIDNQTLGYYIGRTYLFLIELGIDRELLRFRQHKKDEMAHYATDCWDAEMFMSYGWIECVGIADRSCYDLKCHEEMSKVSLRCKRRLSEPREVDEWVPEIDKKHWGSVLRGRFAVLQEMVDGFSQEHIGLNLRPGDSGMHLQVAFDGHEIDIPCERVRRRVFVENVVPDVIEPSFGVGRVLYALFEHSFYTREDGAKPVFRFKPAMAPVHCAIGYTMYSCEFDKHIEQIRTFLSDHGLVVQVNNRSCSIGRKYVSCDELGVPFFVTFDGDFAKDRMVTIRERDSMQQVRVDVDRCAEAVLNYIRGHSQWD